MSLTRDAVDAPRTGAPVPQGGTGGESWLARNLGLFAVVSTIALMVARTARPVVDPDLWWHLRLGQEFRSGAPISSPPPLSTFATESYDARSWLVEIAMSRVHSWFGLPGIAWLFGLAVALLVVLVHVVARRRANPLVAGLVTALVMAGASSSLTERPHMVSYLFLLLATAAWHATIDDLRPRWWLVPMTWLWAACHGMWSTGVLLGIVVVIGLAFDGRLSRGRALRLAAVPVASIAAASLTPLGLRVLSGAAGSWRWQAYITEYASPDLRSIPVLVAWVLVALVLADWIRGGVSIPWAHMAVVAFAAFWILYSARSVTWGVLVLVPLVAESIQSWIHRDAVVQRMRRPERLVVAGVTAAALVALAIAVPRTAGQPGAVPSGLDANLAALPDGTPIFAQYSLGGWLEWEHRNVEPFIDGNTNAYPFEQLLDYYDINGVVPGWEEPFRAAGIQHVLLGEEAPLVGVLRDHFDWQVLATDDGRVLLEAPDAATGLDGG